MNSEIQEHQEMVLATLFNMPGHKFVEYFKKIPNHLITLPPLVEVFNEIRKAFKQYGDNLNYKLVLDAVSRTKKDEMNRLMVRSSSDHCMVFPHHLGTLKRLMNETPKKNKPPQAKEVIVSLDQFALTDLEGLWEMLENDNWVLNKIALQGQITILFAQPNAGKTLLTLKLLIDSVKDDRIQGENVYYINSDDTARGLTTKAEIAKEYKIKMLASGFEDFKNDYLTLILEQLTNRDEATGKIIVLDTLKKFSDLMNKAQSAAFNEVMRAFVAKGGTVIALAHVNKSRDLNGKPIYQGTSDSVDDADCCYTLDVVNCCEDSFQGTRMTTNTVLFENFKARGDNINKASYQYTKIEGELYSALLESVKPVDELEAMKAEKQGRIVAMLNENEEEIQLVLDAIAGGTDTTQKIIKFLMGEGVSRIKAKKVLSAHCGDKFAEGHRWRKERGDKNERIFRALFH